MSEERDLFIDPQRCIGCRACTAACAECSTHRGTPMIHLDEFDRPNTVKTGPTLCMHCDDPACAAVCPADAIKKTEDGVVQTALNSRCIGCSNCQVACPFGVPLIFSETAQMMKCDMCYDRTSIGKKPMCATVCPSGAISFIPLSEIRVKRRNEPNNQFQFGDQKITTRVFVMMNDDAPVAIDAADFASHGRLEAETPWVL